MTLAVAAITCVSEPLFDNWRTGAVQDAIPVDWITLLFYTPFLMVVVGGTVLAFRAMWLSTRRAELAARLALGGTRNSLIARDVRDGARDGVLAGLGGLLLGGSLRQARTGFLDLTFVPNSLWSYLVLLALSVTAFALAYWIAAAWITRGSVQAVASGQAADAPIAAPSTRTGRAARRVVLFSTLALGGVALLLLIWGPSVLSASETDGGVKVVIAAIAGAVINIGVVIALPGLVVYACARTAVRSTSAFGRVTAHGAFPGSARSLAADAVARSTPMRTGAVAAVIAVMGVAVAGSALYFDIETANDIGDDLAPHAAISTVDLVRSESAPSGAAGWAEPLPPALLSELHADPSLLVIDAGVLTSEPREREEWGDDGLPFIDTSSDLLIAVDPATLDAVVPDAGKALYLTAGTVWVNSSLGFIPSYGPGGVFIEWEGVGAHTEEVNRSVPWSGISRPWAESLWGAAPTAAVLLYPAGDITVDQALAAHDLDGLEVEQMGATFEWEDSATSGVVAAVTAPFLALAVAIVIALAWSSQRLRARDHATILALGATPSALRGAAAMESFLVTAVAGAVGCIGGAVIGPILAAVASSAPISTVSPGLVLWNMGRTLTVTPWGVLIALVLGAAVIAAAGAAVIRVRLDRMSPAQQLTEAQKAGTP
ncbi:MAG: ABC transporter permease [Demequina sp.]